MLLSLTKLSFIRRTFLEYKYISTSRKSSHSTNRIFGFWYSFRKFHLLSSQVYTLHHPTYSYQTHHSFTVPPCVSQCVTPQLYCPPVRLSVCHTTALLSPCASLSVSHHSFTVPPCVSQCVTPQLYCPPVRLSVCHTTALLSPCASLSVSHRSFTVPLCVSQCVTSQQKDTAEHTFLM